MAAVGSLLGPVKSLYSLTAAIILCGIYILAGMANGKIKRNSVVDHFSVLESYTICGACPSDLIRWTVISTTPI